MLPLRSRLVGAVHRLSTQQFLFVALSCGSAACIRVRHKAERSPPATFSLRRARSGALLRGDHRVANWMPVLAGSAIREAT
jgi:hypothetical protein